MAKRRRIFPARKIISTAALCIFFAFAMAIYINFARITENITNGLVCMSSSCGFCLSKVIICGAKSAPKNQLREAVNIPIGTSIFSETPHDIKKNLEMIPWVKKAHVERWLPSTIFIKIEERRPIAIWHEHGLVGDDGEIIECDKSEYPKEMLIIAGPEAPIYFPALLPVLQKFESKIPKIQAAIFLRSRRWDIVLANGCVVKMQEDGEEESLRELIDNMEYIKENFEQGKIMSIDLRFKDVIMLEMKK